MLNELTSLERGVRSTGLGTVERHPDIKDVGRVPTLVVQLNNNGDVDTIRMLSDKITAWTLRNGQHNSFPFVQMKDPFLETDPHIPVEFWNLKGGAARRVQLQGIIDTATVRCFDHWPGEQFLGRLRERLNGVDSLRGSEAAALPLTLERFLKAHESVTGGIPGGLVHQIVSKLRDEIQTNPDPDFTDLAAGLLVGKTKENAGSAKNLGALLFDAHGAPKSIVDSRLISLVSEAMRSQGSKVIASKTGLCAISGKSCPLTSGPFPDANLPMLGQSYLYTRNPDTPASYRYNRSGTDTMPVGQSIAVRLAAALYTLTRDDYRGRTWIPIPGEAGTQRDLLLAFVESAPDAEVASLLADDDRDNEGDTSLDCDPAASSVSDFLKRTERVVKSIEGSATHDFRATPVRLAVFRKVDKANRKVVYSGEAAVEDYYRAATRWAIGERNLPAWLTYPVKRKAKGGKHKPPGYNRKSWTGG